MKKQVIFVSMLILSAILMSCGGDNATQQTVKQINSSYDLDGQEVQLVGYVAIASGRSGGTLIMNNQITVGLVNSNWQQKQDAFANAKINFGQAPNCLWLPDEFKLSDVEIYDSNGQKHAVNTQFSFKAKVKYTHKDWESETAVKEEGKPKMQIYGVKTAAQRAEEAKKASEERKKVTGDPNDYAFELTITEISVAK
jgi:hypothetical protein